MDHFKILKRAWDIVCKYRALWLIGLLLVLAGGGVGAGARGGVPSSGPQGSYRGGGNGGEGEGLPFGPQRLPDWSAIWEKVMPIVIAVAVAIAVIFLLIVLIGIVKVIVRYVTRTSLIEMVQRYEETGQEVGFRTGLRLGWSRSAFYLFLTKFLVNLPLVLLGLLGAMVGAALAVVLIVLIVSVANSGGGGAAAAAIVFMVAALFLAMLMILPLVLINVAIRAVITLISEIAFRVCVIEDLGPWEAIKAAVGLIRRNLWPAVLQYLLLLGLGIAWGIALFMVNLPLVFLALIIAGPLSLAIGGIVALLVGSVAGLILGILIFVPVLVLVIALPNLVFTTFATLYHSTVWTLTYRELRAIDAGAPEAEVLEAKAKTS